MSKVQTGTQVEMRALMTLRLYGGETVGAGASFACCENEARARENAGQAERISKPAAPASRAKAVSLPAGKPA